MLVLVLCFMFYSLYQETSDAILHGPSDSWGKTLQTSLIRLSFHAVDIYGGSTACQTQRALDPGLAVILFSLYPPQASLFLSAGVTVNRANSCQSDSSGFLEEPPEPPPLQVEEHLSVGIGIEGNGSIKYAATIGKGDQSLENTRHRHQRDRGQWIHTGQCARKLGVLFPSIS